MEITNKEALESWLKGRSADEVAAIKSRSAMRTAPWLVHSTASIFPFLRSNLVAGVALKWPTPEMRAAAFDAGDAYIDASADLALAAVYGADDGAEAADVVAVAAYSASAVASARRAADAAGVQDCYEIESGLSLHELMSKPLWPSGPPEPLKQDWERLDAIFAADPAFAFWRRWYQGALDGEPVNWEVQRDVALIPTDIWEAGPDRVAEEIARIEAERRPETPPADPASLRQQVEFLLDNAEANEVAARSLAGLIEATSREFRSKCNDIPDEVLTIERLPSLLHRLGDLMEEGADEIEALMKVIDDLRRENAVLRSQLATRDRRTDAGPLRVRVDPASWKTVARDKLIAGTVGALVGSAVTMGGQFLSHVEAPAERAALAHLAKTAIIDEGERR